LSILWPARLLLPEDCLGTCGPRGSAVPPFLLPGAILLVAAVVFALSLRRAVYVWPVPAWRLVAAVGLALTAGALIVDVMTRSMDALIASFVWPMAPGLLAISAASRAWREPP